MPAVKVRQSAAGKEAEQIAKAAEKMAMTEQAIEQLAIVRGLFVADVHRFAKGGHLWATKGWEYVEPEWEADPETWPPVAKLLYLYARMQRHAHDAMYQSHFSDRPTLCRACTPGTVLAICVWCEQHGQEFDQHTAKAMAKALFANPPAFEGNEGDVLQQTPPLFDLVDPLPAEVRYGR